jgi:hypothetical protein
MKTIITRYPYIYNGGYYSGELIMLADFSDKSSSDNFPDVKLNNKSLRFDEKTIDLQKKT